MRHQTLYDQPEFVKVLHKSANSVLHHWHEYSKKLGVKWGNHTLYESLPFLSIAHRDFVAMCYSEAKQGGESLFLTFCQI